MRCRRPVSAWVRRRRSAGIEQGARPVVVRSMIEALPSYLVEQWWWSWSCVERGWPWCVVEYWSLLCAVEHWWSTRACRSSKRTPSWWLVGVWRSMSMVLFARRSSWSLGSQRWSNLAVAGWLAREGGRRRSLSSRPRMSSAGRGRTLLRCPLLVAAPFGIPKRLSIRILRCRRRASPGHSVPNHIR